MSKQAILDQLHALEESALKGRHALSLGCVNEIGIRKLLDRLAGHLHTLTDMVVSLPEPVVITTLDYAPGALDAKAPSPKNGIGQAPSHE